MTMIELTQLRVPRRILVLVFVLLLVVVTYWTFGSARSMKSVISSSPENKAQVQKAIDLVLNTNIAGFVPAKPANSEQISIENNPNNNNLNMNMNKNRDRGNQEVQRLSSEKYDFLKKLERVVHLDLKGAPPKPSYYEKFFPMIREFGATGVLIEYEDMFPYEGILADARSAFAYNHSDIEYIKKLAKDNNLYLIPLVQTYGHLEWLLKLKKFSHLRENFNYPQVISPCIPETYTVLYELLDQVIKAHPDVPYFHIGADEVYYKLENPNCANSTTIDPNFHSAFLNHVLNISNYVRQKLPNTKMMFWDDMLHSIEESRLAEYKVKIDSVQLTPMMWGYMEDVKSYFGPQLYEKYGRIFGKIWIATAFKGASGELATLTSIQHHYLNHVSWINVMRDKLNGKVVEFEGVALTGWSRYDHFLGLCDILPQAIPSLVFNLQAIQYGPLTGEMKRNITLQLGCNEEVPWYGEFPSYMSSSLACKFPGHEIYEAMLPYGALLKVTRSNMEFAQKYVTNFHLVDGNLHKKRSREVVERLAGDYGMLNSFRKNFIAACETMFYEDTAPEWLTIYFLPTFDKIHDILTMIKKQETVHEWKPRGRVTLKAYAENF